MQLKWLQVDYGTTNETLKELNISALWRTDDGFIKKGQGQNKLLSMTKSPSQMNSLRFFPSGKRNCYEFPVTLKYMYLLRAGFYYVVTNTSEEPFFHEVLYTAMREKVKVCLVRSIKGMVPFISSLQCIYVDYNVYDEMTDNKTAFYLRHRIRFGSDKQFGDLNCPDDDLYNRFWSPRSIPNYHNVTSAFPPNGMSRYIDPPFEVLSYAIETKNVTSSIYIPIDFPSTSPLSAYIVLYFSSILTRPIENGRTVQSQL
ncbi:hypothetical protein IFM89_009721 [Coptis chinensis]|uniref:Malectin-like domain-containing protein n=1 Tax=Coptis chinensis TaxID=261450 RepID=A0A835HDY2_9MAGN|nr:hypothetical protein IFM89_009721 [Coptis chinensis]